MTPPVHRRPLSFADRSSPHLRQARLRLTRRLLPSSRGLFERGHGFCNLLDAKPNHHLASEHYDDPPRNDDHATTRRYHHHRCR